MINLKMIPFFINGMKFDGIVVCRQNRVLAAASDVQMLFLAIREQQLNFSEMISYGDLSQDVQEEVLTTARQEGVCERFMC